MKRNTFTTLLLTMMLTAGAPLVAEGAAKGPHADAILQELRAIRLLLEKGAAVPLQQAPDAGDHRRNVLRRAAAGVEAMIEA